MPQAPKRHSLTPQRQTTQHKPKTLERRGNSYQRGYNREWAEFSKAFLRSNPLCEYCLAQGHIVPARVTDHDIPHRHDRELFWNNTYTALCHGCHNGPKQRAEAQYSTEALLEWVRARKGL